MAGVKKKVSISVYLVPAGFGLIVLSYGMGLKWLCYFCLLVVATGTVWGYVDGKRSRIHKRKSKSDPAYADQTEAPPDGGMCAFWVGFLFIVGIALAAALLYLLLHSMTH